MDDENQRETRLSEEKCLSCEKQECRVRSKSEYRGERILRVEQRQNDEVIL